MIKQKSTPERLRTRADVRGGDNDNTQALHHALSSINVFEAAAR
jgi:hypothetical protein